jgi:hypothetical protein
MFKIGKLGLYQGSIFHDLKIILPLCFVFGACIETFMIKTGFCKKKN